MKKLVFVLSTIVLMSSNCKKDPPLIPDDLLIQILTNGEWSVIEYKLNGVDRTPEFAAWRFKFYDTKVVDAKYDVSVTSGTWDGNQSTMTFSANFPNATTPPVTLVNGNWNVVTPGTRIVTASQTSGSDTKTMKLYRE